MTPLEGESPRPSRKGRTSRSPTSFYSDTALPGEANAQRLMTNADGFHPHKAQQGLWNTDPIWQADVSQVQVTHSATRIHYLHMDHLDTPVLGTNKHGATTWKAVAEAFGATGALLESQVEMNLRFPGQYWDGESETHYNFHRDYSPIIGRY
ncbi:MAG: hypothetical protein EOO31_01335 [Comamonadaceae bacterium]|nr:MAG: hypothetical protein EOO31_01335 [Comamonadaceae bacterium]